MKKPKDLKFDLAVLFGCAVPTGMGMVINEIKPNIGRVVNSVTNGIGVMPSFLEVLSDEEIKAVAYYVFESSTN